MFYPIKNKVYSVVKEKTSVMALDCIKQNNLEVLSILSILKSTFHTNATLRKSTNNPNVKKIRFSFSKL